MCFVEKDSSHFYADRVSKKKMLTMLFVWVRGRCGWVCVCTVGVVHCASFADSIPEQLPVARLCLCRGLISQHTLSADYPNPGRLDE